MGAKGPFSKNGQKDNNPKQTTNMVTKCNFRIIKSVFWRNYDKDLISVQWVELKRLVQTKRPTDLTQLHQLCQEECVHIPADYCKKLVEAHPNCLTEIGRLKKEKLANTTEKKQGLKKFSLSLLWHLANRNNFMNPK